MSEEEKTKRLIEAAKNVAQYIELPGDIKYENAVFYDPVTQLRNQADRLEKRIAAVREFRAALKELA